MAVRGKKNKSNRNNPCMHQVNGPTQCYPAAYPEIANAAQQHGWQVVGYSFKY